MSRLRQVPKAEATPEVAKIYQELFGERDPVAEPGTVIGSPGDYWTTLASVPDLLVSAYGSLFSMLQPGRKLPPELRELAILRTAIVGDSKSEYTHQHSARYTSKSSSALFKFAHKPVHPSTSPSLRSGYAQDERREAHAV
jgi:hypothetical protein